MNLTVPKNRLDKLMALVALLHDLLTKRKLNRVFRRNNDPYRYSVSPYEQTRIEAIVSQIKPGIKNTLEIGCAEGILTERLFEKSFHITACDLSDVALKRAKNRLQRFEHRITFLQGNIRHIITTFGKADFDLIVAAEVLYYLGDGNSKGSFFEKPFMDFLKELKRVLSPNGQIILVHGFGNDHELKIREEYSERLNKIGLKTAIRFIACEGPHDKGNLKCLIAVHTQ